MHHDESSPTAQEHPEGLAFFVDDKPYCLWDTPREIAAKNRELVFGFRPDFFTSQAALLARGFEGSAQEASAAAMALRLTYGHAAETVIALLFASMQAGNCLPAWLDLYKIYDLIALCGKVKESSPFPTMLADPPRSWSDFVVMLFREAPDTIKSVDGTQEVSKSAAMSGVTKAISHLAADLCDADARGEYNSYKHGLRVVPVGISATISPRDAPPIEVPGSPFGSLLVTTARARAADHINVVYERRITNYDPRLILRRIFVAVACLECVRVFLVREASKGAQRMGWRVFPTEAHYTDPWTEGPDLQKVKLPSLRIPPTVPLATSDEVHETYQRLRQARASNPAT